MTKSFFTAGLFILLMLGVIPVSHAQLGIATGNYENDLGQLYGASEALGAIKDLCAEEFPEHKTKNEAAHAAWRAKWLPFLQEVEGNMAALIEREAKGDRTRADAFRAKLEENRVAFKASQRRAVFVGDPARAKERCAAYPALLTSPTWNLEKSMAAQVATMRNGPTKP